MADNYLITGYHGVPHVTAENDRGINAAIFGKGRFVLPVGEQFRAEYIGNNTVRMYDGKLMDNGAAAGIPAGRYIDLLISEAGQGKNRNDLIVFKYEKNAASLVESGSFVVVQGEETDGTATDPVLTHEDLLTDSANLDHMALWRVQVSATVISAPVRLFSVSKTMQTVAPFARADTVDGSIFNATVEGITDLSIGLALTILPTTNSRYDNAYLNVNGLGAKEIRRRISGSTALRQSIGLVGVVPVAVTYDGTYWLIDNIKPSANDLYGKTPIESGGTGADTLEKAQKNLQIHPAIESTDYPGCYYRTVGDEREWVNPPMVVGEEFRTAERFCGVPVYTKIVKAWPMENQEQKVTIAIGISGFLRIECYVSGDKLRPATEPYSHELTTTILRGVVENTGNEWEVGSAALFRAWYIRDDIRSLLGEG